MRVPVNHGVFPCTIISFKSHFFHGDIVAPTTVRNIFEGQNASLILNDSFFYIDQCDVRVRCAF